MSRKLWGEFFDEDEDICKGKEYVPTRLKQPKLNQIAAKAIPQPKKEIVNLKLRGSLVTQTIEVAKQTEVLQSLIDTYSNKSETSTSLIEPGQVMPKIDFPPEISTNFVNNDKFAKPFPFVIPQSTPFTRGETKSYPELTNNICRSALRKAIAGLLMIAGFTSSNESALILLTDASEHFLQQLLKQVQVIQGGDPKLERSTQIKISTLELAYQNERNSSLLDIHNYYKHHIIQKNRMELKEFHENYQEYDKLRKTSEEMNLDKSIPEDIIELIDKNATNAPAENQAHSDNAHSNSFNSILDELMKTPTEMEASAVVKDENIDEEQAE